MTMIHQYYTLLDETDWDIETWQALRASNPQCAYSALRAAISEVINEASRPADVLAGILWGVVYSANEAAANQQEVD